MAAAAPGHVVGQDSPSFRWRRGGGMEVPALERFLSPGKGSGLRSRRQVRPGELLYRAEPFAYVVTKEQLGGVCEQCLQRYERAGQCCSAMVCCTAFVGAGRRSLVRAARVRRYRLRCGVRGCVRARGRRHGAGVCTYCSYRSLPGAEREFNLGSPFVLTSVWFSSCLCIPRASLPVLTVHLSCSLKRW